MTYEDYKTWTGEQLWELVAGQPYVMTPAPSCQHQRLVTRVWQTLSGHFQGGPCEAFVGPLDVKLSQHDVVQPDVLVISDRSQDKGCHIEGPPALVVEVLSPSTFRHDRVRKLNLYARFGIQEYWIVTPEPPILEVLTLEPSGYHVFGAYSDADELQSPSFPDLKTRLSELFGPPQKWPDEVREGTPVCRL